MKSEAQRVSEISAALVEILKDEIPAIGGAAMAYLLVSHTQSNREEWLTEMGNLWDFHNEEKNDLA